MLKNTQVIVGYAAFVKGTNKGLVNRWSGGSQTGTNVQSVTDDFDKITIHPDKREIETYIHWFTNHHKKPVEFEIKQVEKTITTSLKIK